MLSSVPKKYNLVLRQHPLSVDAYEPSACYLSAYLCCISACASGFIDEGCCLSTDALSGCDAMY